MLFFFVRPFTKSLQQAASTSVFCATALELNGTTGVYFNNCFRCEEGQMAQDDDMASKLWDISCDMIKQAVGDDAPGLDVFDNKVTVLDDDGKKEETVKD